MNSNDDDNDITSPLPLDDDPPFSDPYDQPSSMPIDHPSKDTGIDEHERYDEGEDAAAGLPTTPPLPDPDDEDDLFAA